MRIDQSRVVGNLNDNQQPNSSSIEAEPAGGQGFTSPLGSSSGGEKREASEWGSVL
jgi:hypothetical protein